MKLYCKFLAWARHRLWLHSMRCDPNMHVALDDEWIAWNAERMRKGQ